MERFARYLAAVDGSNDWATIEPLFDDAFTDDCIFVTDEGEHDKTYWTGVVKGLIEKGAVASGFEVTRQEGDVAYLVPLGALVPRGHPGPDLPHPHR